MSSLFEGYTFLGLPLFLRKIIGTSTSEDIGGIELDAIFANTSASRTYVLSFTTSDATVSSLTYII